MTKQRYPISPAISWMASEARNLARAQETADDVRMRVFPEDLAFSWADAIIYLHSGQDGVNVGVGGHASDRVLIWPVYQIAVTLESRADRLKSISRRGGA